MSEIDPTRSRTDVLTLDHGDVVFHWPGTISQDELDDLMAWIELIKTKMRRAVVEKTEAEVDE